MKKDFSIALSASAINHQPSTLDSSDWLYTETVTPPCALWIAGSGHIAQAVAPLALQLDFNVTIFDDRPELAKPSIFPADGFVAHWTLGRSLCRTIFRRAHVRPHRNART
ncbi:MAG: XdhC family protein [Limisphaerales bacterium]